MSYTLNSANREVVITPSSKFALAAVGEFRGGELLVLFSVDGEFQDYPDQGSQIFNEPSGRVFETNGEPVKLKWTGDLGSTIVSTENIGGGGGSMTAEEIIAAIDSELGTGWRDGSMTASEIIAAIDGEISTPWREGAATIILATADALPTTLREVYDQTLTVTGLGYDGGAYVFGDLVLQRAPDHNGAAAYTSDGNAVEHESNPSTTQSAIYEPITNDKLVLHCRSADLFEYVTLESDASYTPANYSTAPWTAVATSIGSLGLIEGPTGFNFPTGYLAATHYGQLARHGDAEPYRWFTATNITYPYTWAELIGATGGTVPISRGGTGATTAAAALVNLGASAKVKTVVTESDSFTLSAATHGDNWTRLTKSSGATTISLPSMSAGAPFELMRVGAATIVFSGGNVENGAAIANVPVGGWLKLVSRGGTNYDLVAFGSSSGGSGGSRTDVYLANDTWTKPAGAKMVQYTIIGGGGGAGAGRRGLTSTDRFGGGGGGGAAVNMGICSADLFGPTETITVGAGGSGGGNSADGTDGAAGANGGASGFGSVLTAAGGSGGGGGTTTTGAGGAQAASQCLIYGATGTRVAGGSASVAANGASGAASVIGASGGGGGGSLSAANVTRFGGNGGAQGQSSTGSVAGGAGGSGGTRPGGNGSMGIVNYGGSGGGGGAPTGAFAGSTGGNGGLYGGGGGGGSAALDSAGGSTAGGAGGAGIVIVTTYF